MTPGQIALVEETLASVDLDLLADELYRRVLADDPSLSVMFTADPSVQRARFAAELAEIVRSIRSIDTFASAARSLGARHRLYGVRAVHYRLMGDALLGALSVVLHEAWTAEVREAWALAYNLTAESMMIGACEAPFS